MKTLNSWFTDYLPIEMRKDAIKCLKNGVGPGKLAYSFPEAIDYIQWSKSNLIRWVKVHNYACIHPNGKKVWFEDEYMINPLKDSITDESYPVGTILYRKESSDRYNNSSFSQEIKIQEIISKRKYKTYRGTFTQAYLDKHFTTKKEIVYTPNDYLNPFVFQVGDRIQCVISGSKYYNKQGKITAIPTPDRSLYSVKFDDGIYFKGNKSCFNKISNESEFKVGDQIKIGPGYTGIDLNIGTIHIIKKVESTYVIVVSGDRVINKNCILQKTNSLINKNIKNENNLISRDPTQIKKREISRRSFTESGRCISKFSRSDRGNQKRNHDGQEKAYLTIKRREL